MLSFTKIYTYISQRDVYDIYSMWLIVTESKYDHSNSPHGAKGKKKDVKDTKMKADYTDEETIALLENYRVHKDILQFKFKTTVTNPNKYVSLICK